MFINLTINIDNFRKISKFSINSNFLQQMETMDVIIKIKILFYIYKH